MTKRCQKAIPKLRSTLEHPLNKITRKFEILKSETIPSSFPGFYHPKQLIQSVQFNFVGGAHQHAQFARREAFALHPLQVADGDIAYQGIFILTEGHPGLHDIHKYLRVGV